MVEALDRAPQGFNVRATLGGAAEATPQIAFETAQLLGHLSQVTVRGLDRGRLLVQLQAQPRHFTRLTRRRGRLGRPGIADALLGGGITQLGPGTHAQIIGGDGRTFVYNFHVWCSGSVYIRSNKEMAATRV